METRRAARRTTPPPMAARPQFILLLLAVSSCAAAGTGTLVVGEDYVRPPAGGHRKALLSLFPWSEKKTYSASDPQQVHISLAGEKHVRITWITDDNSVPSFVDYGTKAGTYTSTSQGESTSYTYLMYSSGKIHHVVIGPLEDNTVYYYRCGGQGPEFQFKTPPSQFPLSLAVVGDLGQTSWTTSTLNHIKQCEYDILLLPGDLSYADYMQHLWDSFGKLVEPLASTHPWMVTEGNHEKEHIPFFKSGFQSYNARWKMPYEESGSTSNLYYSFDVAGAHIVMLGSYMDYDENSDQYAWLKDSPSLSVSLAPKLESAVEAPPNAGNDASPLQVSGFAESAVDVGANAAHNTCVQQGSPSVARHYPNPGRNANNHVLRRQHIPEVRNHGDRPTGFNNLVLKAQDRAAAARGFLLPNDSRNSGNVKGKPRVVNETTGENSKNTTKFCGSKGHVAHKCRTAKHLVELYLKSRKEKEANQKCYRCGTMGHLSQMSHAKTPR